MLLSPTNYFSVIVDDYCEDFADESFINFTILDAAE